MASMATVVGLGVIALVLAVLLAAVLVRLGQYRRMASQFARGVQEAIQTRRALPVPLGAPPAFRQAADELDGVLEETRRRSAASTELIAANRLLAREVKRLTTLLDAANEGVVATDATLKVVLANKGAAPFLSMKPEETLGHPIQECLKNQEVVGLLNGQSQEGGARGVRSIELAPEATGTQEHYAVFHSHARWKNEETAGELLLFRDISRIKNSQKLQAQFVDSVAHELRTPLTSIRAYVEMLIDDEAGDPQMKYDFYNIIYEETYRLSELIDNLLNISMLEGGTAKLDIAPTRLKRVLEEAIDVIRPQCEKKKIDLVVELPDRLPTLNVDKRLLNVAFMNVLGNAAKYTSEGGTVTVSSSSHEEELQIAVRDTGMGISAEDMPKIFDKFYRAPTSAHIQGSGVGLATARQIVQLHGGDIRVSSTVNEGSHFIIALPRSLINTSIGE
ncbi:MAG: hypothetical protein HYZ00_12325 [Candidatus Hydrogenedentes bacterium]|nr:hypothetical protein [Candidatus Hydrogenedentota bacterium]